MDPRADVEDALSVLTFAALKAEVKRALAAAPDDRLATYMTAEINLCDCVMAWSHNGEAQKAIGAAALDRYLRMDPTNEDMQLEKADLFMLRGRFEESLVIAESVLQRDPEDPYALWSKAQALLRLGRAPEALPIVDGLAARYPNRLHAIRALAAAEAHLGHMDRARTALADFNAAVPNTQTITAIKKWMYVTADLAGSEQLFEGLRLAGLKD